MVGGERVFGNYSGVSPRVSDDHYRLQNLMTWRMEFVTRRSILHFDLSFLTFSLFNLKNSYNYSTVTEERMLPMQNRTGFRGGKIYLPGNQEKETRLALGWQVDWRHMGITPLHDPGQSGYHVGSLERTNRLGLGGNAGIVHQFGNWGFTRVMINLDVSPWKLKSIALYPEWQLLAHYRNIGLYSLLTYRIDYMWGNLHLDQVVQPVTDYAIHKAFRFEMGLLFDFGLHGK